MFHDPKPYSEYVETGSPWLRRVPSHWRMPRLKTVVREVSDKGHPNEPLLAATQSRGVIRKDQYENRTVEAMHSLETLKLVAVGDFVISLRSFQGGIERALARGIISPAYTILRPLRADDTGYLTLLFKSRPFIDALRLAVTGIREGQNIEYPRLAHDMIPLPPPAEQEAIVTYLAHAHQRINQAIATKRRLIALLEEQKQALTRQAVTAGLGAGTLRDSGFAHIGLIPTHWRVLRAKHLFREFDRRSGTGQETLLSLRQAAGLVHHHEVSPIAIQPEALMNYKVVMPGAVVMNRMRAASGVFAVAREIGLVSPDYSTMSVGEHVVADYYLYLFKTPELMAEFRRRSSGLGTGESGFMRLQYEAFGRIPLPVPPAAEQQAIANLVEERRAIVDAQIDLARREIGALQEFSTCLTAEVVTGQLDVRGVAAALPRIDPAAVFASASVDACEDDDEALEGDALEEA